MNSILTWPTCCPFSVSELSHNTLLMSEEGVRDVYQYFIRSFLSRQNVSGTSIYLSICSSAPSIHQSINIWYQHFFRWLPCREQQLLGYSESWWIFTACNLEGNVPAEPRLQCCELATGTFYSVSKTKIQLCSLFNVIDNWISICLLN